jgi:PilZ domain-containing protein
VTDPVEGDRSVGERASRIPDRRRHLRVAVPGLQALFPTIVDAEILEISLTGALVRCRCPLRVGDRASIRTVLNREPFVAKVSVVRVLDPVTGDAAITCAGVAFLEQDEESARVLGRFLTSHA